VPLRQRSDWEVRQERLNTLEARAVEAITNTYGPDFTDDARFWLQKGIEGMRLAVAEEDEAA
jgi:hypothetical protein